MPRFIHDTGQLFKAVQLKSIFTDSKVFPDCFPKFDLEKIEEKYLTQKDSQEFDLNDFVFQNFAQPEGYDEIFFDQKKTPISKHIENLWSVLTRKPEETKGSLIPLPYPYIVPGGRFREMYYWDSYFTILGLQTSQRTDLMQYMVDNFAFLIDHVGYIPNGNRTYYLGRSQPPFFSLMVMLLVELKVEDEAKLLSKYINQLEKEYQFWMSNSESLNEDTRSFSRIVIMPDGSILNRYWDENNSPRPEAYKEDIELAHQTGSNENIYRDIRAAAESGWDFSSRWFNNPYSISTIHTTEIVPVDLNCLLYHLEETLARAYQVKGKKDKANAYNNLKQRRKAAIQKYCWSEEDGFYCDYDIKKQKQTGLLTAATTFPLFFDIASMPQAEQVAETVHFKLLKAGGVLTTTQTTGQQWDAPNGWAPLQYITIMGLEHYGMMNLACEIARRWVKLNIKVYNKTGKLMEKYNVVDTNLEAGGGEYPSQDGFGWTNGVLLKLMHLYNIKG